MTPAVALGRAALAALAFGLASLPADDAAMLLPAWTPPPVMRWRALIAESADRHAVPPALVAIVALCESRGDPAAVGAKGERGIMQVRNGPTDPRRNIEAGARVLAAGWRATDGDVAWAIARYQAGPGGAARHVRSEVVRSMASMYSWRAQPVLGGPRCGGAK